MTDKRFIYFTVAIVSLIITNIFLTVQIATVKKTTTFLEAGIEECKKNEETIFEKIDEKINSILDRQEESIEEIKKELALIKNKSDAQFLKTVNISKTYDAILEEQKKKTIDTAEKDKTFLEAKNNALSLYKKGRYAAAYNEYKKLSDTNKDDLECHLYKTKSLFYMNKTDSSKYAEILDGIKILRQNASLDDECLEIEKAILVEQEGFDE